MTFSDAVIKLKELLDRLIKEGQLDQFLVSSGKGKDQAPPEDRGYDRMCNTITGGQGHAAAQRSSFRKMNHQGSRPSRSGAAPRIFFDEADSLPFSKFENIHVAPDF